MPTLDLIYFGILPALFIVFFTWAIRFPSKWIFYNVCIGEILLASIVLIIEFNARNVAGTSGWMLVYTFLLQFFILFTLAILRLVVWFDQK